MGHLEDVGRERAGLASVSIQEQLLALLVEVAAEEDPDVPVTKQHDEGIAVLADAGLAGEGPEERRTVWIPLQDRREDLDRQPGTLSTTSVSPDRSCSIRNLIVPGRPWMSAMSFENSLSLDLLVVRKAFNSWVVRMGLVR